MPEAIAILLSYLEASLSMSHSSVFFLPKIYEGSDIQLQAHTFKKTTLDLPKFSFLLHVHARYMHVPYVFIDIILCFTGTFLSFRYGGKGATLPLAMKI